MTEELSFYLFGAVALVGAVNTVLRRNPVHGALFLVCSFLGVAGLFLSLGSGLLAAIQVMVYAGAIMVLFLFVIMLLNLESMPSLGQLDWRKVVAFVLGIVVLAQLLALLTLRLDVMPAAVASAEAAEATSATNIGIALLTEHAFSLEIVGVLLLAATVGAVMLAKKRFV